MSVWLQSWYPLNSPRPVAGEVGLQPFQLVMDDKHLTYILALGKKDVESSGALNEVGFSASWKNISFSMHIMFEYC